MKNNITPLIVSYGEIFDEFIEIKTISDEIRFKICMKLYKTHTSIDKLVNAIDNESLKIIDSTI